jgi:hypothetical protein
MANAQNRSPLGEFRKTFLNQRIIVNQNFSSMKWSFLGSWVFVKEKKGVYTTDLGKQVPATFAGEGGTIIAVIPESGAFWPPRVSPNPVLTGAGPCCMASTNC